MRGPTSPTPSKIGKTVTVDEKKLRAEEIALKLGDHKLWHSHGRSINVRALRNMGLKIEDYSDNRKVWDTVRCLAEYGGDFATLYQTEAFVYTRS